MYVYPDKNLDDPTSVLSLLGTLWSQYYGGNKAVAATVAAQLELLKQHKQNASELLQAANRFSVPHYHIERWMLLKLPRSEYPCYPLPDYTVDVPLLLNRMTRSTLILYQGLDYCIDNMHIVFKSDPFANQLVPRDGDTAYLWGFRGKLDYHYAYEHFGYLLGLKRGDMTPDTYRNVINAVLDCYVAGTTVARLERLLAAATNTPLANGQETLQELADDRRGRFIVTTHNVHRINQTDVLEAPIGATPCAGTPLVRRYSVTSGSFDSNCVAMGSNCVVISLAAGLRTPALDALVDCVLPPQTGVAYAEM